MKLTAVVFIVLLIVIWQIGMTIIWIDEVKKLKKFFKDEKEKNKNVH